MIQNLIKTKVKKFIDFFLARSLIRNYLIKTPPKKRKLIVGGHWSNNPGWLILNEGHQDLTKKLKIPDSSFKVIFLEHVFEHIEFIGAVNFLQEAKRILQNNGTIRIVAPFLEKIISVNLESGNKYCQTYIQNSLINLTYPEFDKYLKSLNLKGINEDPNVFFFNSLFRKNNHRFIWSAKLLKSVMKALGYKKVEVLRPGLGRNKEYIIERRQRGVYTGSSWQKNLKFKQIFDPESLVVEAIK